MPVSVCAYHVGPIARLVRDLATQVSLAMGAALSTSGFSTKEPMDVPGRRCLITES